MYPRLISFLAFLIAFQLLFVGVFLITHRKGNRRNNRLLSILFILLGWNMADLTLQMNDVVYLWEFIRRIDDGFFLLYGPLFYFYGQGVIFKDFKFSAKHLIHILPFLLLVGVVLSFKYPSPGSTGEIATIKVPWQLYLGLALMYVHLFTYLGLTYKALWDYRKVIKNTYSQIDSINLNWLSSALNTFGLLIFASLMHNFVSFSENETVLIVGLTLLLVFLFYFVNKVILKALRQPEVFAGIAQNETTKYHGSNLTADQIEAYKQQVLAMLKTEKLFLDPQVSIADLSEKLSVPTKQLSQVINQCFHKSFFDFINSYRIEEVQHLLKTSKDDKLTVLEVMYQAGFNSKSSFNTAFKKETGQTPTEFRKSIRQMRTTS